MSFAEPEGVAPPEKALPCKQRLPNSEQGGGTYLTPTEAPDRFALLPSYPNPFNPFTTIAFPRTTRVYVEVPDLLGRSV